MQRRAKKELFGPHMIVIAMLVTRKRLVEDFENLHLTFCYLLFSDHFSEFFTSPILVQTISLVLSIYGQFIAIRRRSKEGPLFLLKMMEQSVIQHFAKVA